MNAATCAIRLLRTSKPRSKLAIEPEEIFFADAASDELINQASRVVCEFTDEQHTTETTTREKVGVRLSFSLVNSVSFVVALICDIRM